MKKILTIALVAVSVLALGTTAFALIAGSHHDLTSGAKGSNYDQDAVVSACEYCHAPHHGMTNVSGAPLWNRSLPTPVTAFTMYGDTINGTSVSQTLGLGDNSLTCLSCHDGATAMGNLVNKLYMGDANQPNMVTSTLAAGSYANVAQDLRNDHPVGFNFTADRAQVAASNFVENGGGPFKLYRGGTSFECASCHDPHDTTTGATGVSTNDPGGSGFFLRADIATICTDCHAK